LSKKGFEYTGQETLEVLKDAKKYNDFLIGIATKTARLSNTKAPRILDFGAGIGTYTDLLKNNHYIADCLEPDSKQAKILASKGYTVYTDVKQITKKYEVIFAFNVFEHIEDDEKAMRDLTKILAENGHLIIYVPAFQVLFSQLDKKVGHYRRYRLKGLKRLAGGKGLKVNQLQYCDPLGFLAALAYRAVGGDGNLSIRSIKLYDGLIFPISRFAQAFTAKLFGKNALIIVTKSRQHK
jgi:SAM-dependent methyltransferase